MEKWTPLTEKYGCSPANLVIRYTASAIKNLNILCGARKPEQMLRQILPLLSIYLSILYAVSSAKFPVYN